MDRAKLARMNGLFLVAVVLILLALPNLVDNYIRYVMTRLFVYVLVALGLNLLTGYTGQVSLGHAAFFAIGAYTAAVLAESWQWPSAFCVIAAAAFTAISSNDRPVSTCTASRPACSAIRCNATST